MTDRRSAPEGYESSSWDQVTDAANIRKWIRAAGATKTLPIYIHGDTGSGKTSLAALLYRTADTPLWRRCDDFLLTLATTRTDASYNAEIAKAKFASCLFLDDIGLRKPTEAMNQIFFDLLEMRKGKPTVITSNHTPEHLAELYDDRITSRILAGTIITLQGVDRREGQGKRHLAIARDDNGSRL